jgi:hypothetical protein
LSGTGTATTLSCSADSTSTTSTAFTSYSCGTKLSNKTFKNGQTVISCNSSSDCQLTDLTYADCICVFKTDNTGICEADISNDAVYGGFWTDCGTTNTITDKDAYYYWILYMSYWEYSQSTVTCMSLFTEASTLSDLYDAYNGAATLAVGVFGLLALY